MNGPLQRLPCTTTTTVIEFRRKIVLVVLSCTSVVSVHFYNKQTVVAVQADTCTLRKTASEWMEIKIVCAA